MEPKRYWWVQYTLIIKNDGRRIETSRAIDIHPFILMSQMKEREKCCGNSIVLNNWKIVSCEEYNLFNDLNN